jgi:hypothetical protein
MAALAVVLVVIVAFSTFSTLAPATGMMAGPPANVCVQTYISYCFDFNDRKEPIKLEAVVNALEKWTFFSKSHLVRSEHGAMI